MTLMKAVADFFRSSPKKESVDHYGILSPLLATGDYVGTTTNLFNLIKQSDYASVVTGNVKDGNKYIQKAVEAYKLYVHALSPMDQTKERHTPFSTMKETLDVITGNITQIEDNFQPLFGSLASGAPEMVLRSSSLVIFGYLEKSGSYAAWLGNLIEHLTAKEHDLVPPFRTKELITQAADAGAFASMNLSKWNNVHGGFLNEIKDLQKNGADVAIQSGDGSWIDDYLHDNQFNPVEQNLITASLRSPIMMAVTFNHVRSQNKIDLLTTRKEWLVSKIMFEEAKMRGLDEESPEYKRMKKATDHYADLVSHYEQKIERMYA